MLTAILSFTEEGKNKNLRIGQILRENGCEVRQRHFGRAWKEASAAGERGEKAGNTAVECGESALNTEIAEHGQNAESAAGFAGRMFSCADLLIFVGACGIAVRLIAPHVRDKKSDPAVLAVDELGRFVIPLLSGHLGGANQYARWLAGELGATAVITTATDLEGRFAPDLFAEKYCLKIRSMEDAKAVAAAGLRQDVKILFDVPCVGELPPEKGAFFVYSRTRNLKKEELSGGDCPKTQNCSSNVTAYSILEDTGELYVVPEEKENEFSEGLGEGVNSKTGELPEEILEQKKENSILEVKKYENVELTPCLLVTNRERPETVGHPQCVLTPENLILGIGCKRGIAAENILSYIHEILREHGLAAEAVGCLASIDIKQNEPGLLRAAETLGVPFYTFCADELNSLMGDFTASEFVKRKTGTDNVCERSAMLAWKKGSMVRERTETGRKTDDVSGEPLKKTKMTPEKEPEGRFIVRKQAKDGITLAVYEVPVKAG